MNLDLSAEPRRLRDLIEEKDEEIRQLREAGRATFAFPSLLGLTATQARIVSRLLEASPQMIGADRLRLLCLLREETLDKTIHVHVLNARRKLAAHGVAIRNHYGEGYSMEKASAERLKGLIA